MTEAGDALYALIAPYADQVVFNASIVLGSAHWFLARLSEGEQAARHLAAATETHRRLDAPLMLARAEVVAT